MIRLFQRLPDPNAAWFEPRTGKPTRLFYTYMREVDDSLRRLVAMTNPLAVADLPVATMGDLAFASNGRKNGEGAGAGTGVLVFYDGTAWRACDTGATVAA